MNDLPPHSTVLGALLLSIRQAAQYNSGAVSAPAVILWPDEARQWEAVLPRLRQLEPHLLTLGDYDAAQRQGPAIWVRALLAGELEAAQWHKGTLPVVYLPGVGRATLREVENFPKELKPLAELQYRGAFWSQQNGKDWTPSAFLKAGEGLGLLVAKDEATNEALRRALSMLADTPVAGLQGRVLGAADFNALLAPDVVRDLLRWMNEPKGPKWPKEHWAAFCAQAKDKLKFDPKAEGELSAAERMATGASGDWKQVWARFAEAPAMYAGVTALLEKVMPPGLLVDAPQYWPRENEKREGELRTELLGLAKLPQAEAINKLAELEAQHGVRRGWVWALLDRSALARALEHLALLAAVCAAPSGGTNAEALAKGYQDLGWKADDAALRALSSVDKTTDIDAVKAAVRAVYEPWLTRSAQQLQSITQAQGYAGHLDANQATLTPPPGQCVLFVDGLRFDLGRRLQDSLGKRGLYAELTPRWSPLPSVTATGKPAVSPFAHLLGGGADGEDFMPSIGGTTDKLTSDRFRNMLGQVGVDYVAKDAIGTPSGRGWTEFGDVDTAGHTHGWKLARSVREQLHDIAERIDALLAAGWSSVRVVTDHGWLLLPGGLPKTELPIFLTDSRWGRCAALKDTSSGKDLLVTPWWWSSKVRIALAPGISCFKAGEEYTHGGLSLQECLTPVLTVTGKTVSAQVIIAELGWTAMRCSVKVIGAPANAGVEVRSKAGDPTTKVGKATRGLDEHGKTSLVIPDDSLEGNAVVLVVVSEDGTVLAKKSTCVGGEG